MKKLFLAFLPVLALFSSCSHSKKPDPPIGGHYDPETMKSFVNPPKKVGFCLGLMSWYADQKAGKEMLTGKILGWSGKIATSSGLLELYVEEGAAKILDPRMMTLIRMKISYTVPNTFAIDINAQEYKKFKITTNQLEYLQGTIPIEQSSGFSEREKAALLYATALSKTPVVLTQQLLDHLRSLFSEREIIAIAALSAKVNFWTRLIEGLRVKPAGYSHDPILKIDEYDTFVK